MHLIQVRFPESGDPTLFAKFAFFSQDDENVDLCMWSTGAVMRLTNQAVTTLQLLSVRCPCDPN